MSRSGYTSKNVRANIGSVAVAASQTDSEIAPSFSIRGDLSRGIVIDIEASVVTVGAGITAKLQVRQSNEQAWIDSKTVSITATGTSSIKLLDTVAADQTHLPLRPVARLVVTTGAGSAITIDKIFVLETSDF